LEINALLPTVLLLPSVSLCSVQAPTAVLSNPVVSNSRPTRLTRVGSARHRSAPAETF
jgi:hypothetical protein